MAQDTPEEVAREAIELVKDLQKQFGMQFEEIASAARILLNIVQQLSDLNHKADGDTREVLTLKALNLTIIQTGLGMFPRKVIH